MYLCHCKMWKSNVKNFFLNPTLACQGGVKLLGFVIAQSPWSLTVPADSRQSERQNIIDRTHTWQQCLVTTSEDISKTIYSFNRREISPLSIDNNTNTLAGSANWHTFEATCACTFPHASWTSVAWNKRSRGNSLKCFSANFSTRRHDEGKCMLLYCCFGHYRMLAYKISACELCIIWRKPTEALKIHCQLPSGGLGGKPAMVTLKIQLDCSMVHDTTLWEFIFVRSHLGCGTDSIFHPFFCRSH